MITQGASRNANHQFRIPADEISLEAIVDAILRANWTKAAALATTGLRAAEAPAFPALLASLLDYINAQAVWYQSWDYETAKQLTGQGIAAAQQAREQNPLMVILEEFLRGELETIAEDQDWMRLSLSGALEHSRQGIDHYRQALASLAELRQAAQRETDHAALERLVESSLCYLQGTVEFLSAYQSYLLDHPAWRDQVKRSCATLRDLQARLSSLGAGTNSLELSQLSTQLSSLLQVDAQSMPLILSGVDFRWSFRRDFPLAVAASLIEHVERSTDRSESRNAHMVDTGMVQIPVLGAATGTLNDVFERDIGESTFVCVDFFLPSFELTLQYLGLTARIEPSLRIYAAGVVVVDLALERLVESSGSGLTVAQLQALRVLGLPQTAGHPMRIGWLPPHTFTNFPQVCESILLAFKPLIAAHTPESSRERLDEYFGELHGSVESAGNRQAVEHWLPFAFIRVADMDRPAAGDGGSGYGQLGWLTRAIPETIDPSDYWAPASYDPADNLASVIPGRADQSLFFLSSDHAFLHFTGTFFWAMSEYVDLIEFTLNVLARSDQYLKTLQGAVERLQEVHYELGASDNLKLLKQYSQQRIDDIERLTALKSQLIELQVFAQSARVTRYPEHRALLNAIARAVNLHGAIEHAEAIVEKAINVHQGWEEIGRIRYQERALRMEKQRTNFEGFLLFLLQLIGIAQVISSLLTIIAVRNAEVLSVPLPFSLSESFQVTGKWIKFGSIWALIIGMLLIFFSWIMIARRTRVE